MSHFTVLVLMRNDQLLGDLLAPYNENKEVPPYISTPRDEFIADKRKWYSRDKDSEEEKDEEPDYSAMSDEDFLQAMREKGYELDEAGNEISTYNPKSQWDWWTVGGRWNNLLRLKEPDEDGDGRCNYAYIKELNFDSDPEVYKKRARFWELCVEDAEPENEEEKELISWQRYKKEFYIDRYGTKENYATLE
ncbi:MAG: hypothetical protein M0P26_02405, partial [Bacteroidales bacterium]|nr:hypothetical protein [Bacteroidales bacterium]